HTTKIIHGEGSLAKMAERLKSSDYKRSLIVTDDTLVKTGLVDKVVNSLENEGVEAVIYSKIEPNPTAEAVDEGYEWVKEYRVDNIIAVGGGSSIDAAKSISVLATNGGNIRDYEGMNTWKTDKMYLTAVPTTVGTGSEVTFGSVITDNERQLKMVVAGEDLSPALAILDPAMIAELPPKVTASTGMDALTQAIESYVSSNATPITEALSIHAIGMIAENIRPAVLSNDFKALENMQMAATIAGISFINGGLGIVHGMANTVGGFYNTPHGVTNAVILPYGMEYNLSTNLDKFLKIAEALGENIERLSVREAAEKAVGGVNALLEDMNMPTRLSDLDVDEENSERRAEYARVYNDTETNERHCTTESITNLYRMTL